MHSEVPLNTEVTKGDGGDVPFDILGGGVPALILGLNLRIIKPKLKAVRQRIVHNALALAHGQ